VALGGNVSPAPEREDLDAARHGESLVPVQVQTTIPAENPSPSEGLEVTT
jgi:hypothetical protein